MVRSHPMSAKTAGETAEVPCHAGTWQMHYECRDRASRRIRGSWPRIMPCMYARSALEKPCDQNALRLYAVMVCVQPFHSPCAVVNEVQQGDAQMQCLLYESKSVREHALSWQACDGCEARINREQVATPILLHTAGQFFPSRCVLSEPPKGSNPPPPPRRRTCPPRGRGCHHSPSSSTVRPHRSRGALQLLARVDDVGRLSGRLGGLW